MQAVKLDSAPSQAKARPGTGSDPADSAFAGLMAQASLASMTPASSIPEPAPRETDSVRDTNVRDTNVREANVRGANVQQTEAREAALERTESQETEAARTPREGGEAGEVPEESEDAFGEPAKAAASKDAVASKSTSPPQTPPAPDPTAVTQAVQPEPDTAGSQLPAELTAGSLQEGLSQVKTAGSEGQKLVPADAGATARPAQGAQTRKERLATNESISAPAQDLAAGSVLVETAKPTQAAGQASRPAGDAKPVLEPPVLPQDQEQATTKLPVPESGRSVQPEPAAQLVQKASPTAVDGGQMALAEGAPRIVPAVAHVAAPAPVRPSPILNQVEGSIRWILQNKVQGAELQLHPESLGRMVISLRVEGQEVHARLWASEPTSLALLQDHKAFLQASLREQGLNLGSFDLQSGARGDGAQTMPQERPPLGTASTQREPKQEMPIFLEPDSAASHRIEVFA